MSSLNSYIEMIPNSLIFGQHHVQTMLYFINTVFIFASLGVVLSAASLTNKNNAKEIIGCVNQLRSVLMQGLGIFITGMTFMHFWMKYAIEVSEAKANGIVDLAIGIQFYHAILYLSIILLLAILTHNFLRKDYDNHVEDYEQEDKERAHGEWRLTASYYREFITAIGLFIPPLLGILGA